MIASLYRFRRSTRWLGAPLALLLAVAVLVGAAHHHYGPQSHDPCAICTAGHTPAVAPTLAAAPSQPVLGAERVVARFEPALRLITPATPSSRAPPLV